MTTFNTLAGTLAAELHRVGPGETRPHGQQGFML